MNHPVDQLSTSVVRPAEVISIGIAGSGFGGAVMAYTFLFLIYTMA